MMANYGYPLVVPPLEPSGKTDQWQTAGASLLDSARQGVIHPAVANFAVMMTAYRQNNAAEFNKALGRSADYRSESTISRIKNAGEPVVKYLLMGEEAELTDTVKGTSSFAEEFMKRGPRDRRGRSLRDLDLKRRLFAYPCSYVIYSEAFDALPGPVKDYVLRRLWEVLGGQDTSKDFVHLSADDRQAILDILRQTKTNLPDYWKQ